MAAALLIFVPVIFILVAAAVKFIGPGITRHMNARLNFSIAGVYIAVLLLLSVGCLAIPSAALKPELRAEEAAQFQGPNTFENDLKAGILKAPAGIERTDRSFTTTADHITVVHSDNLPGQIYVGTKGSGMPDNGSPDIDVYIYTAGSMSYKGMSFAAPPSAPEVTLDASGRLSVKPGVSRAVTLYEFDDRATIPQFTGVDTTHSNWSSAADLAIVVLIPPGLSVESTGCVMLPSLTV